MMNLGPALIRRSERYATAAKKSVVRGLYHLPILSSSDPSKKVVTLKDCTEFREQFPPNANDNQIDWRITVRPQEKLSRKSSISLDAAEARRFDEGTARFQGGYEQTLPEVSVACFHQASLFSPSLLLLNRSQSIVFESALSKQEVLEQSGILTTLFRGTPEAVPGDACLLASPWSSSFYYHWLIDALPRLEIIEKFSQLESVPLVVCKELRSFHRDTLRLAGVNEHRLHRFNERFSRFDRLYFPDVPSPTGNISPHAVEWLRSRFLKSEPGSGDRLIYISRKDAMKRKLLNEDEIIGFLQQKGFEIVCPGTLPFSEQVEMFRRARVVIGPHGAGFTNMAFAPRDATMIEFFGDNYINGCFWTLANVLGQRHAFVSAPTETLNFSIPVNRCAEILEKACNL
jgi:Capsular polysaccharide biosynthesis protein